NWAIAPCHGKWQTVLTSSTISSVLHIRGKEDESRDYLEMFPGNDSCRVLPRLLSSNGTADGGRCGTADGQY
ncbi:MAG: hypothetical protein J6E48_02975, partial [Prevotella sp.]|nr:hypothetical protein [Prevotella sp.]